MDHGPVPTADGARCTMATGVDAVHGRGRRAAAARAVRARMHDAQNTFHRHAPRVQRTVQRTLQRTVRVGLEY